LLAYLSPSGWSQQETTGGAADVRPGKMLMFRPGDVFDNPITGERATIRLGTRERLIVDLELRGAGFGFAPHLHPVIHERLTVVSGRVGIWVNGVVSIAKLGKTIDIPPGVPHRFWNAGICEAKLTIDIRPADRFEAFVRNMIGLAQDGKTNPKGMPNLLHRAIIATEFDDVIHFLNPPLFMQRVLFPILAPIARICGYRGSYSEYLFRLPSERVQKEAKMHMLKHF
jgi:mannose-6-phosphate isomerase-like protein (cupin superfamily)